MKKVLCALLVLSCVATAGFAAKPKKKAVAEAAPVTIESLKQQIAAIKTPQGSKYQKDLKKLYTKLGEMYYSEHPELDNVVVEQYTDPATTKSTIDILTKKLSKYKGDIKNKEQAISLYFELGKAYYNEQQDYTRAKECFDKVLKVRENGTLYRYKGATQYHLGQYAESVNTFGKALKIGGLTQDDLVNLFSLRGGAQFSLGNYKASEIDLNSALNIDPGQALVVAEVMSHTNEKLGNYDKALYWATLMAKDTPQQKVGMRRRAEMFYAMNNISEFDKAITALESVNPEDGKLDVLKAQLCFALGEYAKADNYLQHDFGKGSARDESYDYDRYCLKAQLALVYSEFDKAFKFVDLAVKVPASCYNHKLRGDIYLAMGDPGKALTYYEKYLKGETDAVKINAIKAQMAKIMGKA